MVRATRVGSALHMSTLRKTQIRKLHYWRHVIVGPTYGMGSNCSVGFFSDHAGPTGLLYGYNINLFYFFIKIVFYLDIEFVLFFSTSGQH